MITRFGTETVFELAAGISRRMMVKLARDFVWNGCYKIGACPDPATERWKFGEAMGHPGITYRVYCWKAERRGKR